MRSNNPVLTRDNVWSRGDTATLERAWDAPAYGETGFGEPTGFAPRDVMTIDDVVMKTGGLLTLIVVLGAITWMMVDSAAAMGIVSLAGLLGFVLGLVNVFKRQVSPPLVIAYAVCQGVFLGGISKAYESEYAGIVLQAVIATAAVFAGVLVAYRSGKLRATPRFRKIVVGGLIGLVGLVMLNVVIGLFAGGDPLGLNGGNFGLSVLVGLGLIVFGALSFVLDFDEVERLARAGVSERESWRAAFGLVLGLVFLYLQILRLLAILRGDD